VSQNPVPEKGVNAGSTLYLIKKNDRILLTVDNDWSEWWVMYPHPKDYRYLVIEARQQREFMLWGKKISYSELGVKNFSEALLGLFLNTNKYMEKFTGKKSDIINIVIDGDSVEINNFGLDVFSYNKPKFVSGEAENVEVVILKFDNRFEIVVSEPSKLEAYLFRIRQGTNSGNKFEVENDDGTKSEIEFGVGNICELFRTTLLNPRPVIEKILNKKVFITKITIENFSWKDRFGFGSCSVIKDFDIPFIEKVLGNYDRIFDENNLMYKEWTLVVEEYGNRGFGFYLKDDPEKRKWVIEPHDIDDSLFVLSFIRDGREIVSLLRKYYDYGSANIEDIIEKLIGNPQIMLGALTNVSARISNVEVVNENDDKRELIGLSNPA
jgi:hypothetical protein